MSEQTLGFVGLGAMGSLMSARLVDAGYEVIGFDVAGTEARKPAGAIAAASVEEIAGKADTVFLSVPDGAASKSVIGKLISVTPRRTKVVVDLSTIGITAARECARVAEAAGLTYVDAPVSGGVAGARAGTLAVMVGAEESVYETLRPMLGTFAANAFRMGDSPGLGQAMKLLNNFLSATSLAATSEAVVFGTKMGLDLAQIVAGWVMISGPSFSRAVGESGMPAGPPRLPRMAGNTCARRSRRVYLSTTSISLITSTMLR